MTSLLYHFKDKNNETKTQSIISCPSPPPLPIQEGRTALIWASLYGHDNVVEKLLAAGISPNHQDNVRNLATRVMLIHVANRINAML